MTKKKAAGLGKRAKNDLASLQKSGAIAYFCGWLQLMLVMGISPEAAFLAGVAPFVVVDVLKILAAVACARAVKAAVR